MFWLVLGGYAVSFVYWSFMTDPSITRASIAYVVALAPCIFAIHSLRRSMQMKHKMLLGRHSSTFKVQGVHIQKFKSVIF